MVEAQAAIALIGFRAQRLWGDVFNSTVLAPSPELS